MTLLERNVHMPLEKPTKKSRNTASTISKARLAAMIEEATADAYGDSEQTAGRVHDARGTPRIAV
jgi:hypothetical protein